MERFKAVEKAMKTKAYSKEGLSAAAKLDPKEKAKVEASEFLSGVVDDLEQQIESLEAESESIQASMKKGKGQNAKTERIATIERIIEKHKWHQGKLELIRRSLENGGVEAEQVNDIEESIKYYVAEGMQDDFMDDEELYDDLNLQDEEDAYGMNLENDRVSSQDTQSVQEEAPDVEPRASSLTGKARTAVETAAAAGRRPSTQLKSPLPTLATLHTPLTNTANNGTVNSGMKPASLPTRPAGEGLKYASAAAAAAASDKNNVGIAPLPPPPGSLPAGGISPLPPVGQARSSAANSPATTSIQPAPSEPKSGVSSTQEPRFTDAPTSVPSPSPAPPTKKESGKGKAASKAAAAAAAAAASATSEQGESSRGELRLGSPRVADADEETAPPQNGISNGVASNGEEEESIYHLPASLQDLVESFETTKKRPTQVNTPSHLRMLAASQASQNMMDNFDSEPRRTYRPEVPTPSVAGYPQEPLPIFDDPRLYGRIEPDTLFYVFYYKQGTYQQYLAAKALKEQSWRFHKQYQTWFQRHEEPKQITEEFEKGTYRFFDYESTWWVILFLNLSTLDLQRPWTNKAMNRMNRRKAEFQFHYRFLEDDV